MSVQTLPGCSVLYPALGSRWAREREWDRENITHRTRWMCRGISCPVDVNGPSFIHHSITRSIWAVPFTSFLRSAFHLSLFSFAYFARFLFDSVFDALHAAVYIVCLIMAWSTLKFCIVPHAYVRSTVCDPCAYKIIINETRKPAIVLNSFGCVPCGRVTRAHAHSLPSPTAFSSSFFAVSYNMHARTYYPLI